MTATNLKVKVKVKVKIMSRLAVSRPVWLDIKHPSKAQDQIFITVEIVPVVRTNNVKMAGYQCRQPL
jgi:hypothetical protein